MRGIGYVRSAAALYAAALVLAMGPLNTAQAQAVAAAPVAAPASEPRHGDLLWKAARKGDWAAFDQTLAKIAADGEANAGLAEAAATFQKLLAERPDFPAADRALFELGLALARADKPDDAARAFADLVKRFPRSTYAADAWLEVSVTNLNLSLLLSSATGLAAFAEDEVLGKTRQVPPGGTRP